MFFDFADGTQVLHYYLTENYPSDNYQYVPEEHNIFYTDGLLSDIPSSWDRIKIRPKRYRYEYAIRK